VVGIVKGGLLAPVADVTPGSLGGVPAPLGADCVNGATGVAHERGAAPAEGMPGCPLVSCANEALPEPGIEHIWPGGRNGGEGGTGVCPREAGGPGGGLGVEGVPEGGDVLFL
jgi:hypothetical protein